MRVGCELLELCRFELTEYRMRTQECRTLGTARFAAIASGLDTLLPSLRWVPPEAKP